MKIETLTKRIKQRANLASEIDSPESSKRIKWYSGVLEKYLETPLTLSITDVPMKRVCQVLTNHGYTTTESCEGHGTRLPKIFFQCDDQDKMRDLAYIVNGVLNLSRFPWQIVAWASDPYLNPESKLRYILQPENLGVVINPATEHKKLLEDLDFIGIETISYFNTPWRFRKVDKDLRKLWRECYDKKE